MSRRAKTDNKSAEKEPQERDCILGEGSAGHKTNLLLLDVIRYQKLLWKVRGKAPPTKESELDEVAAHVVNIITKGKQYELAGLKDVPRPFMKSQGRFLAKAGTTWKVLSDAQAKKELAKIMLEDFQDEESSIDLNEAPYKDFATFINGKTDSTTEAAITPETKDAILLKCEDSLSDKLYEQQGGNKTIFHLASQLVTSFTNSPERRVEAALAIFKGMQEVDAPPEDKDRAASSKEARFLVRTATDEESVTLSALDPTSACEFVVIFVFEVFLEKEIHVIPGTATPFLGSVESDKNQTEPSKEPVSEPTDYDVLFGRGGMTNSHPGNRRFRDIIALHRPDYIRAIKMDKPNVARKIVKAIRMGIPPGRFLKKGEDGRWYDVGDRTAAEKTSQGLRERSNAEKRQRSALREALRIRREDMPADGSPASKKAKLADAAGLPDLGVATTTPILNYIGTNFAMPLSLSMKEPPKNTVKKKDKDDSGELNTEGLPPNAVDEEGNILVTDYDILCGRGGLTNHHKGNKRFRDIVALHRPDYVRAPKIQKPSVARVIVRAIRNGDPPGRFLRKDEKSGKWIDIGDKKAAEKTSQALREKTNEEREKLKHDPNALGVGVGVLLPNPATYLAAATAGMLIPGVADAANAASVVAHAVAAATKTEEKTEEEKEEAEEDAVAEKKTEEEKQEVVRTEVV